MSDPGTTKEIPLRQRLTKEMGKCLASDLRAHVMRGFVVVVRPEMDLLEIAVAVAEDDAPRVKEWISRKRMHNPSHAQIDAWEAAPDLRFRSVIVRPYVLVQELDETTPR